MNDAEIERELSRLSPARVPGPMLARLHAAPPFARKIVPFPVWIAFAAAAAVLVCFFALRPAQPGLPPETGTLETFQTVEVDHYLVGASDLGVVEIRPGEPYRLVHCVWADLETYRSASGPGRLEVRQARDQIVPIALEFQ